MTHPDEGPETADERDWWTAYRIAAARVTESDRASGRRKLTASRPIANVRAAGVAVRFVLWLCAALLGTVALAYGVAAVWE